MIGLLSILAGFVSVIWAFGWGGALASLPTCLDALTGERESWLILLTPGTSQAAPVNGPMMR